MAVERSTFQQFCGLDGKGFGDPVKRAERDIFLRSFNRPDVGPVQSGFEAKFLLGETPLLANRPDCYRHDLVGISRLHGWQDRAMMTITLQPISSIWERGWP
jgi:hypothetical protein